MIFRVLVITRKGLISYVPRALLYAKELHKTDGVIIRFALSFPMRPAILSLVFLLAFSASLSAQVTTAATFGTVIALGGTPSDVVMDESRQQLYLVNSAKNRVDILNMTTNTVVSSVNVGVAPLAAAMSMDNAFLYVTNSKSSTLSVISLTATGGPQVIQTVTLPAVPEGVAVGGDGRALIGTQGTNSLLIFDPTQVAGAQLTPVSTPPPPSTPSPLPTTTTTRPQTTFNGKLIRTPDGLFIVGLMNPGAKRHRFSACFPPRQVRYSPPKAQHGLAIPCL